jgi:P4 family phage/plasmid primase-like protien
MHLDSGMSAANVAQMPSPLARAISALGIEPDEHLSVLTRRPGQPQAAGGRRSASDLSALDIPQDRDVWIGLIPIPPGDKRGKADEALRIPAIWADLDVGEGKFADFDSCESAIMELSMMLGSDPAYVTMTGHGLQPVWAVDDEDSRDVERMTALLPWFGVLVRRVAEANGGSADSVFDAARVLRAPGSTNWKDPATPVPTTVDFRGGRPLSASEITDVLEAYGIDRPQPGGVEEHHPAANWQWANSTCSYTARMIDGWQSDVPARGRHPWLVSQCVRLMAAHRRGCVAQTDYQHGLDVLRRRMDLLRATTGLRPGEVEEALKFAGPLVESFSDDRCARELGNHQHDVRVGEHRSMTVAERLVPERLAGRFIYADNRVGWHQWDGARWKRCSEDVVIYVAHEWVKDWLRDLISSGAGTRVVNEAARYRDIGMLRALVQSARTFPDVQVDPATLDQQPGLLNCANGVVDLRTGRLGPHDPSLMFTKMTPVMYRPGATHPDWDRAREAFADVDSEEWVRRHLGAALSGTPGREDVLALHHGKGENGKTTVLAAALAAFGEFGGLLNDKVLIGSPNEHQTIYMELMGKRLMLLEELPEGHILPVDRVKKLVETPTITARGIGQDPTTFTATHSLVVSTNYVPTVRETDHGTWRRLVMIDYPHTFTGARKDRTLRQRCRGGKGQQEAVLAWLVAGAVDWYAHDEAVTEYPGSIVASTESWRGDADPMAEFLEGYEVTGKSGDYVLLSVMHTAMNNMLLNSGEREWSAKLFSQRLASHRWMTTNRLEVTKERVPEAVSSTRIIRGVQRRPTVGAWSS